MILYTLRCRKDHAFEAWFRDSALYEQQVAAGGLRCPVCGSKKVEKAIMAPSVAAGRRRGAAEAPEKGAAAETAKAPSEEAVMARKALLDLRRQVEDNLDYVGPAFAEEARKIHYGEVEKRGIYGETSEKEARALREEGVAVQQIPWIPRGD